MSELNDVAGGETIASTFTNQVKERTVMRYASAASRDASIPAPIEGSLAYLQDVNLVTYYNGTNWVNVIDSSGGTMTGALTTPAVRGNATGLTLEDNNTTQRIRIAESPSDSIALRGLGGLLLATFTEGVITMTRTVISTLMTSTSDLNDTEWAFHPIQIGVSAPTAVAVGDIWIDTTGLALKRWNGADWITVLQGVTPV